MLFPALQKSAAAGVAAVGKGLSALASLSAPSAAAGLPLAFLIESSILPVVKVLIIAGVGLVTALPFFDVLHHEARKSLSKLVFVIFLPAIIFVSLGEAISFERLLQWWFIPVNVILASVLGCLLGMLVAWATDCPPEYFRVVFILTGIGNMGNMPLVLLSAVCSDSRNPFGGPDQCLKPGIAYIALGMWTAALIMWGVVYNILAPPEEWLPGYHRQYPDQAGVDHKKLKEPMVNYVEPPDEYEDYEALEEEERERQAYWAEYSQGNNSDASYGPPLTPGSEEDDMSIGRLIARHPEDWSVRQGYAINRRTGAVRSFGKVVKKATFDVFVTAPNKIGDILRILHIYDIFRPPVLAAFLAMLVGMIPPLDHVFFSQDGALRFFTDALAVLGQAMIPCILLVLGANLVDGPGASGLPPRTTLAVVVTRLVVVPIMGVGIVLSADRLGFLPPGDQMFRFILLVQHAMPSSIQIGNACSLRGFGEKEVAAVLFFEHISALLTMGCCLFGFFRILYG